jgi:putative transposase
MSRRCSKDERRSKKVVKHSQQFQQQKLAVVLANKCHLRWGDVCGYGWGKTSERLVGSVGNAKERQSYFGAFNGKTGELVLQPADKADSTNTVAFLKHLHAHYQNKQLWVIWDNASYHCSQVVKNYLP